MFKTKSPQDRIRIADRKKQKYRDKRAKVSDSDPDKAMKYNKRIHELNVELEIAKAELNNPTTNVKNTNVKNTTTNFTLNKNDQSKQYHGHLNFNKKDKD